MRRLTSEGGDIDLFNYPSPEDNGLATWNVAAIVYGERK